jgi:hypothetical protein
MVLTTYPSNVEIVREWRARSFMEPAVMPMECAHHGGGNGGEHCANQSANVQRRSAAPWAVPRHVTSRFKSRDGAARNELPHSRLPTTWHVTSRPADCALVPAPHCRRALCPVSGLYTAVRIPYSSRTADVRKNLSQKELTAFFSLFSSLLFAVLIILKKTRQHNDWLITMFKVCQKTM